MQVFEMVPKEEGSKTTAFFSATFPEEVQQMGAEFLKSYVFMSVGLIGSANSDVAQEFKHLDRKDKIMEVANLFVSTEY